MELTATDKKHLSEIHPDLRRVIERAATMVDRPFRVIDGARTVAEQKANIRRGVSKTMRSRHLPAKNGFSHAVDLGPIVNGSLSWDWQYYYPLAKTIKEAARLENVNVEWGGDWKSFKDGPHWQLSWKEYPGTDAPTITPPAPPAADPKFDRAVKLVLRHEGGFVDHPADKGGPTNLGVTIATFRRYVNPKGTVDDLKHLTVEQASTVFRRQYWDEARCSELPDGLAYAVFDFAVNSGPKRAIEYLQRATGAEADGIFGPKTLAAAKAMNPGMAIKGLCDLRLEYLQGLSNWSTFGRGWTNRVNDVRDTALSFVAIDEVDDDDPVAPIPTPAPRMPEPITASYKDMISTATGPESILGKTVGRPDLAGRPVEVAKDILKKEGSRTIANVDKIDWAAKATKWLGGGGIASLGITGGMALEFLKGLPPMVWVGLLVTIVILAGMIFLAFRQNSSAKEIAVARVDDAVTGNATKAGPA